MKPNQHYHFVPIEDVKLEELNKEKSYDLYDLNKKCILNWSGKFIKENYKSIVENPTSTIKFILLSVPELKAEPDGWIQYFHHVTPTYPKEYGHYEVFRKKCNKQHYETWNIAGWASNNNDITHYRKIVSPLSPQKQITEKKIPLEDISDEDAIEVAKIFGMSPTVTNGTVEVHRFFNSPSKRLIVKIAKMVLFLQSRNYELPTFYPLTTK